MTPSGELLLSLAVKATLLLAGAALVATALGRASAAVRHLVWTGALAGLLMLPLLSGVVPRWQAPAAVAGMVLSPARVVLDVTASGPGRGHSATVLAWWMWALGAAIALAHAAMRMAKIGRVLRRARPFEGLGDGVLVSADVPVPAVFGLWRPRVVLPEDALTWPAARTAMVLRHERMHIARHDTRTHHLAMLACAFYWPNPLVWWAASRLRREAEQACDDGVLEQGVSATAYAGELVGIVKGLQNQNQLLKGGLAMGGVSELEHRLKAMLRPGSSRRRATPLLVAGTSFVSIMVLLAMAAVRAPAQQNGGITGAVRDASGAVVTQARVTILLPGSGRKEFAFTGKTGEFAIQPLPEGSYTLTVAKTGFALLRLEGLAVKAGVLTVVKPVLSVGQVQEALEVRGERPGVLAQAAGGLPPNRIAVKGSVQAPKLTSRAMPAYPPDCKAEGVEGTVLLRAVIGTDGSVLNLEQVNELVDRRLATAATDAVRQWRYQPTLLNGVPVEVVTEIEVNFTLTN